MRYLLSAMSWAPPVPSPFSFPASKPPGFPALGDILTGKHRRDAVEQHHSFLGQGAVGLGNF